MKHRVQLTADLPFTRVVSNYWDNEEWLPNCYCWVRSK